GMPLWPSGREWVTNFDASLRRLLSPFFMWRLTPSAYQEFTADYNSPIEPKGVQKGYIPSTLVLNFAAQRAKADLQKAHDLVRNSRPELLLENRQALERLIAEFQRRGLRVLLLRFPKHRALQEIFPQAWDLDVQNVAA